MKLTNDEFLHGSTIFEFLKWAEKYHGSSYPSSNEGRNVLITAWLKVRRRRMVRQVRKIIAERRS